MAAPVGNQNATKQKRLFSDCLKRELTQNPDELLKIVRQTINAAIQGDSQARALVVERLDGKAPQPVVGGDDEDNPIKLNHTVEYIGAPPATSKA